jgi:hypothetical protein
MKIVDLDEIYKFLLLSFPFEVVKMLKKFIAYLDLRVFSIFHTCSLTPLEPNLTAVAWKATKKIRAVALKSAELFQWLIRSFIIGYVCGLTARALSRSLHGHRPTLAS